MPYPPTLEKEWEDLSIGSDIIVDRRIRKNGNVVLRHYMMVKKNEKSAWVVPVCANECNPNDWTWDCGTGHYYKVAIGKRKKWIRDRVPRTVLDDTTP